MQINYSKHNEIMRQSDTAVKYSNSITSTNESDIIHRFINIKTESNIKIIQTQTPQNNHL